MFELDLHAGREVMVEALAIAERLGDAAPEPTPVAGFWHDELVWVWTRLKPPNK